MKKLLLLLIPFFLLMGTEFVSAQTTACQKAFDTAERAYVQGDYPKALSLFQQAKDRCSRSTTDADYANRCDQRIRDCNQKIEAAKKAKEEAAKKAEEEAAKAEQQTRGASSTSSGSTGVRAGNNMVAGGGAGTAQDKGTTQKAEKKKQTWVKVNTTVIEFEAEGGTQNIPFTVSDKSQVKIAYQPDWVVATVDNTSNALSVTCRRNTGSARKAEIQIEAGDSEPVLITVSQERLNQITTQQNTSLSVDRDRLTFKYSGETQVVKVSTNAPSWKVLYSSDWCKTTTSSTQLTIICQANKSNSPREGQVTIQAPNSDAVILVISQYGAPSSSSSSSSRSYSSRSASVSLFGGLTYSTISATTEDNSEHTGGGLFNYAYDDETLSYKSGIGYRAGVAVGIPLGRTFSLKPGIIFSTNKFTNEFSGSYTDSYTSGGLTYNETVEEKYTETYSLSYVKLPVLFQLDFGVGSIGIGPYVAYGISGKATIEGTCNAPKITSSTGESYYRNCDISGYVNLFETGGEIVSQFQTGSKSTHNRDVNKDTAPYNRLDYGISLELSLNLSIINIGFGYDLGMANMANSDFFSGYRVSPSYDALQVNYNGYRLVDYVQKNRQIYVTIGLKF